MARFRKRARRSSGFFRARSRGRSSSGINPTAVILGGIGYGFVRQKVSNAVAPLTSQIPVVGNMGDELVLGAAGYLAAKKGKGMIRTAGLAVLGAESYRVGEQLANGGLGGAATGGYTF